MPRKLVRVLPQDFRWVYDKGTRSLILVRTIRKDGSFRVSSENHKNCTCSRGSISPMRCLFEVFLGSNQSWRSPLRRKLDGIRLTRLVLRKPPPYRLTTTQCTETFLDVSAWFQYPQHAWLVPLASQWSCESNGTIRMKIWGHYNRNCFSVFQFFWVGN